jgi:HEAT repeat protein
MLAYLERKDRYDVVTTSLIRLLRACDDPIKWPAILNAIRNPSPLLRAAAAESLGMMPSKETGEVLIEASDDEYHLV